MKRREFLGHLTTILGGGAVVLSGCRGHQGGAVLSDNKKDMVGSNAAGAETFKPLIDDAVGQLLAQQSHGMQPGVEPASFEGQKRVCFVGVENKSSEELGDFKDQICEIIDTRIIQSGCFKPISRRYVEKGLIDSRLRADDLFVPAKQQLFLSVMQSLGQPFDYLVFASLSSGTTRDNKNMQRDYLLTLEMVNIHTGEPAKAQAHLRKGYYKNNLSKLVN